MNDPNQVSGEPPRLKPSERLGYRPFTGPPPKKEADPLLILMALFDLKARDELLGTGPVEKIYSVPRRFDLATLFVVSTAFGFFCALLGYINFSWFTKLSFCLAISLIGTSQAVLYGGRAPRLSSIVSGAVVMVIMAIVLSSAEPQLGVEIVFIAFVFGPFVGYLVGTVVGGVFLIADNVRQNWPEWIRV